MKDNEDENSLTNNFQLQKNNQISQEKENVNYTSPSNYMTMEDEIEAENARFTSMLSSIISNNVKLQLNSTEIIFTIILEYLKSQNAIIFTYDDLKNHFKDKVAPFLNESDNSESNAKNSIKLLEESNILFRSDNGTAKDRYVYSLSALGDAIANYYNNDDILSKDTFIIYMTMLKKNLSDLNRIAENIRSLQEWEEKIDAVLKTYINEILNALQRRQKTLDRMQEDTKKSVTKLLKEDVDRKIEKCEQLLETTKTTLKELNDVMLSEKKDVVNILSDIDSKGEKWDSGKSTAIINDLESTLERLDNWGVTQQKVWTQYFCRIQRYIRTFVTVDPERRIVSKLNEAIRNWPNQEEHLVFPHPINKPFRYPSMSVIKIHRDQKPRPIQNDDIAIHEVPANVNSEILDEKTSEALTQGCQSFSAILNFVLPFLERDFQSIAIGRIVDIIAPLSSSQNNPPQWVKLTSAPFEVEELNLDAKKIKDYLRQTRLK